MHKLQVEQVTSWKKQKGGYQENYYPGAISSHCPHCAAMVSYSFSHWHKALHGLAVGKTHCPSCSENVRFILLDYEPTAQAFDEDTSLWIYPPLSVQQGLVDIQMVEELDDKLISAYESTINVFNSGEWNATAILIRRFLDGINKATLGADYVDEDLDKQLQAVIKNKDLSRPITKMAETVSNGMAKKFFNLEVESTKACSSLMIEFTELLVEYLYIIPMRAEALHQQANELKNSNCQESSDNQQAQPAVEEAII